MDEKEFENITNDYLIAAQNLVYTIEHFIRKTNKSTASEVRKAARELEANKKEFKESSIGYFK